MKKLKSFLVILFMTMIVYPFNVKAENKKPEANKEPVKIYIFRSNSCQHCINTMTFLEEMKEEYGDYYEVKDYEVSSLENSQLFEEVASFMGDSAEGVPYIVVGKYTYPDGFEPDSKVNEKQTMGEQLIERILEIYESDNRYDVMEAINNKPDYSAIVGISSVIIIVGLIAVAVISRKQNS